MKILRHYSVEFLAGKDLAQPLAWNPHRRFATFALNKEEPAQSIEKISSYLVSAYGPVRILNFWGPGQEIIAEV